MTFNEFRMIVDEFLTGRFQHMQHALEQGQAKIQNGVPSFPTLGVLSEFQHHFVAELFGHAPRFKKIDWYTKTKSKNRSVNEYFQQFQTLTGGLIRTQAGSRAGAFLGVTLSDCRDASVALARLNLQDLQKKLTILQYTRFESGTLFLTNENVSLFLIDCVLLNSRDEIVRAKWMSLCIVGTKDLSTIELERDLSYLNLTKGSPNSPLEYRVHLPIGTNSNRITDTEFRSLYLTPLVRETAIGGYVQMQPELISRSTGGKQFIHELELAWQPPNDSKPAIRPDILIQRADGYWDICDLKTAELWERSLVTGSPSRRRFKEQVLDGAAQLAQYAHNVCGEQVCNSGARPYLVSYHRKP